MQRRISLSISSIHILLHSHTPIFSISISTTILPLKIPAPDEMHQHRHRSALSGQSKHPNSAPIISDLRSAPDQPLKNSDISVENSVVQRRVAFLVALINHFLHFLPGEYCGEKREDVEEKLRVAGGGEVEKRTGGGVAGGEKVLEVAGEEGEQGGVVLGRGWGFKDPGEHRAY